MQQRLHDGMLGAEGLQQHPAGGFGAAGTAGNLVEELDGALGGAEVSAGEAEVGIDDADQRQMRKMPALGDDLRADDEIDLAVMDGAGGLGGGVRDRRWCRWP
jgi:hypothetical protein